MQPNLKRTIGALAGVASLAAVVLLVIFMMRGTSPTPAVEVSESPSEVAVNLPDNPEEAEVSGSVPSADLKGNQLAAPRKTALPRKVDSPRNSQEASSTVALADQSVTESLVPLKTPPAPEPRHDDTAIGVVPTSEELETHAVAVRESDDNQSVIASLSAPAYVAAEDRVSTHLSGRASELLAEIQREGAGLMLHAERLGIFSWNRQYAWQSHAHYLDGVKRHINSVGQRTAELQRIRHAVLPWQQQAITDITAHAAQVAASTQAAIAHLRENQDRLFVAEYRGHLTTIAERSEEMTHLVGKFLDYEKAQQKSQELRNELEISGD